MQYSTAAQNTFWAVVYLNIDQIMYDTNKQKDLTRSVNLIQY